VAAPVAALRGCSAAALHGCSFLLFPRVLFSTASTGALARLRLRWLLLRVTASVAATLLFIVVVLVLVLSEGEAPRDPLSTQLLSAIFDHVYLDS